MYVKDIYIKISVRVLLIPWKGLESPGNNERSCPHCQCKSRVCDAMGVR